VAFLRNEEIGNASGLYNLFRNIGGSIGISIVNTIVARHEQLHHNELLHSLAPSARPLQDQLQMLQQYLYTQGNSTADALHKAYGLVEGELTAQARLWSYVDDFRYLALLCFACIPIVFMLKKTVGRGAPGAH
jgi:MFS transporter, DHA2 family, multidrug resistance protein